MNLHSHYRNQALNLARLPTARVWIVLHSRSYQIAIKQLVVMSSLQAKSLVLWLQFGDFAKDCQLIANRPQLKLAT